MALGPEVQCSDHESPGLRVVTALGGGTVAVDHDHVQEGCCPTFTATAIADVRHMRIEVAYSFSDDFCDCICQLDVSYTLGDVPAGIFELRAAGDSTTVEVK